MSDDAYRCEACGTEFDSERALERHIRSIGLVGSPVGIGGFHVIS